MYILPVFPILSPLRFFAALKMTHLFWDKLLVYMVLFYCRDCIITTSIEG